MSNLVLLPSGNAIDIDRVVCIAKKDLTTYTLFMAGAGGVELGFEDFDSLIEFGYVKKHSKLEVTK